MERIHTLIDKLYQQKAQNASPAHLLFTVQLLQQELSQLQTRNGSFNTKKVSVTLPVSLNLSEESLRTSFSEAAKDKEIYVLDAVTTADETQVETVQPVASPVEYVLSKPTLHESFYEEARSTMKEEPRPVYVPQHQHHYNAAYNAVEETPTLTQYAERKEVHHILGDRKESLNDRLKDQKTEVAHRLKESPIKDLRKAIGINDRFVFVKELFRGDDAAYERSIKTINAFNIYSEAEYWMARELRLKLAWADNNETVQHFYSLVKRRFS
jgi:cell division protein ZapA (FtsZ GTPase activity inhibitor)